MRTLKVAGESSYQKLVEILELRSDDHAVQRRNLTDSEQNLVCPLDCLVMPKTKEVLVHVHPVSFTAVLDIFKTLGINLEVLHLNSIQVIS